MTEWSEGPWPGAWEEIDRALKAKGLVSPREWQAAETAVEVATARGVVRSNDEDVNLTLLRAVDSFMQSLPVEQWGALGRKVWRAVCQMRLALGEAAVDDLATLQLVAEAQEQIRQREAALAD